jgi:hypothetical protein
MNLAGARVLLVADEVATLERVRGYLAKAGARRQVASRVRVRGLSLLDAIREHIRARAASPVVDSKPESPCTD